MSAEQAHGALAAAAGDARLAALATPGVKRLARIVPMAVGAVLLGYAVLVLRALADPEAPGLAFDFAVFWAAGGFAAEGRPLLAFDQAALVARIGADPTGWLPWTSPPGFLALLTPLGLLPLGPAWLAFLAASLGALALALRPLMRGAPGLLPACLLAPACLPALMMGQASLLWLAGLLAGLAALLRGRAVLAGVLIGCLTLKPQLGLLIPVALLAAGAWTTILAATVTALLLAGLPLLGFGAGYWPLLAERLAEHYAAITDAAPRLTRMASPYVLMRAGGLAHLPAIAAQWGLTALAALAVWSAWRRPGLAPDLRAALLCAAIPVATPYLWHYDAALALGTALFLARAGFAAEGLWARAALLLLWAGPGLAVALALLTPAGPWITRAVTGPVLLLGFALAARAALARGPAPAGPPP
ncbi:hypothetical protein LNKW23_04980 [Paralimibaculum aggregatum]|uniref:DUF2029 domain-containing protein n=1 Tax=Paralimibaculum aggregatum TaxID=3036245 RepID=A0ABQ6LD46_9RHOB|nr:glycosyltransferase family 87 protein [Limibaculum sp. NKW23]GMG81285.1 hypothetical protein LNKW23_04980 [Limibaculum sp. NKW23]